MSMTSVFGSGFFEQETSESASQNVAQNINLRRGASILIRLLPLRLIQLSIATKICKKSPCLEQSSLWHRSGAVFSSQFL